MKWAKTTRYHTSIRVQEDIFNVMLESDFGTEFAVYVGGEYVCDVTDLPDRDKLEEIINEMLEVDEKSQIWFPAER